MKYVVIVLGAVVMVLAAVKFFIARAVFKKAVLRTDPKSDAELLASVERRAGKEGRALFEKELSYLRSLPSVLLKIKSSDGLELYGKLIEVPNAKGTAILFHGYRSSGECDFAASVRYFKELSFNLLIPTQRAHGDSEGQYITYGAMESKDLAYWCRGVESRYGSSHKVLLYGVSMGGSACLMCMGQKDRPKNVRTMIVDGAYSSLMDEMRHVIKMRSKLPALLVEADFWRLCNKKGGFDPLSVEPAASAYYLTTPVLYIHGDADGFVPYSHAEENFKASASKYKKLLTLKGGVHAVSFLTHPQLCKDEISEFLNKHFK